MSDREFRGEMQWNEISVIAEMSDRIGIMYAGRMMEIAERVVETLSLVGLPPNDYKDRYRHQMSGGESQRAGIACALVLEPEFDPGHVAACHLLDD